MATAPDAVRCGICMTPIGADEARPCASCGALYHADCWVENRGCATYGCPEVPSTEGLRALEVAPSYWGQEEKACPSCGATLRAAAVRCRGCGATFEAARPEDQQAFGRRQDLARRAPGLRRVSVALFVLSLIPCTAPLAGVSAAVWYAMKGDDIRRLSPLHVGLARLAVAVGIGQTVLAALAAGLYAVLHE